jgi:hypothetical protein
MQLKMPLVFQLLHSSRKNSLFIPQSFLSVYPTKLLFYLSHKAHKVLSLFIPQSSFCLSCKELSHHSSRRDLLRKNGYADRVRQG